MNFEEKELFSEEKIFEAFNRKLKELDSVRKNLEKEEYELEQDYTRLTQGKVLELPEEFETILQELGGILKRYYESKVLENQTAQKENQTSIEQKREENTAEKEKLYRIEEDIQQAIRQVTIRETKSNNYDRLEQIYNERYQTSLRRNILGEYEPGTLEILEEEFQREWEQKNRERTEK